MFQPIDGSKLLVLMIAGGVIAAVGLYLMLRPKPEDSAKIELFGLKFESSSAGLVVFVIGAAFLAVPLFVPEKAVLAVAEADRDASHVRSAPSATPTEGARNPTDAGPVAELSGTQQGERDAQPSPGAAPPSYTMDAATAETEPNDTQRTPNGLSVSQRMSGSVGKDKPDWFVTQVPPGGLEGHEIMLKHVTGSPVYVDAYNVREEHMGRIRSDAGAKYLKITTAYSGHLTFRVSTTYGSATYELAIVPSS